MSVPWHDDGVVGNLPVFEPTLDSEWHRLSMAPQHRLSSSGAAFVRAPTVLGAGCTPSHSRSFHGGGHEVSPEVRPISEVPQELPTPSCEVSHRLHHVSGRPAPAPRRSNRAVVGCGVPLAFLGSKALAEAPALWKGVGLSILALPPLKVEFLSGPNMKSQKEGTIGPQFASKIRTFQAQSFQFAVTLSVYYIDIVLHRTRRCHFGRYHFGFNPRNTNSEGN